MPVDWTADCPESPGRAGGGPQPRVQPPRHWWHPHPLTTHLCPAAAGLWVWPPPSAARSVPAPQGIPHLRDLTARKVTVLALNEVTLMGSGRDACPWLLAGLPFEPSPVRLQLVRGGSIPATPCPHTWHAPPSPARPWGKRPGALQPAGYPHLGHSKRGEVTCPFTSPFMGVWAAHLPC